MTSTEGEFVGPSDRSIASQFFRFCVVGIAGFAVDATVLTVALSLGVLGPFSARFLSFSLAVSTTFLLNRRWSFKGGTALPMWSTFLTYLGVQGTGFICNFAVYSVLYVTLPSPVGRPIFCLAFASAISMLINFLGSRNIVFKVRQSLNLT